MARTKKVKSKEPKGYRRKVMLGLVPHHYDTNSKAYQAGAWRHHSPSEAERNRLAIARRA